MREFTLENSIITSILKPLVSTSTYEKLTYNGQLDFLENYNYLGSVSLTKLMLFQVGYLFIALIFRKFFNRKFVSATFRHYFVIFFGFLTVRYLVSFIDALELLILPTTIWLLMKFTPNHAPKLSLILCFGINSFYQYIQIVKKDFSVEDVDFGLIMHYMLLIQRMSSIAYSYSDGLKIIKDAKNKDKFSKVVISEAFDQMPTYLEIISYTFCFFNVNGGPRISFKHFKHQMDHDDDSIRVPKSKYLKNVVKLILFSAIPMFLSAKIGDLQVNNYLNRDWLDSKPWWYILLINWPISVIIRTQFYFFWTLCDILNNLAGFGYNQTTQKWDYTVNMSEKKVEFGTNIQDFVNSWNTQTTNWLRLVAYERVNKKYAALWVFVLSSLWHGFWFGQYIFLFGSFFILQIYKNSKSTIIPFMEKTFNSAEANFGKKSVYWSYRAVIHVLLHVCFNYGSPTFKTTLNFEHSLYYLKRTYFLPIILVLVLAYFPFHKLTGKYDRQGNKIEKVKKA